MNADTLANVIQVVATLIALVGLAVTFVFSYQGQKLQKQQAAEAAAQAAESNRAAQAAAQRAAASAALTIDDLARIAGALEKLAAERVSPGTAGSGTSGSRTSGSRFEAPAAPATVAWRLTHEGGDAYRLTNAGAAPAFDVWVGGSPSLDGPHDLPPTEQVVAGASVGFRAAVVPTTVDSTITVTWASSHGGADRSSWRYPLPGA